MTNALSQRESVLKQGLTEDSPIDNAEVRGMMGVYPLKKEPELRDYGQSQWTKAL